MADDRRLFGRLEPQVVPRLFEGKRESERIRIWSVGCATGEETYSLAILLLEEAERRDVRPKLQVFASDLSAELVARARQGLFAKESAERMAPGRLERFFVPDSGSYRIRREVRDIVVFAVRDVLSHPPFAHLDLVVCRDLLREFQPAVRRDVLALFHYALAPGGLLVVGHEEEVHEAHLFEADDNADGLYRALPGVERRLSLRLRPPSRRPAPSVPSPAPEADEELSRVRAELQSSREELQVLNEELRTLDEENAGRIEELDELSTDLQHLLEATAIATLFLDRGLRVVRFTPQAASLFMLQQADRGRPVSGLNSGLEYPELTDDARRVLDELAPVERTVRSESGAWYLARVLPYRAHGQAIDGVVMTFVDITDRKRAEDVLWEEDRRKDQFLATLGHELRNPLAPIVSGLELLKSVADDPAAVQQVRRTMDRQAQQLVRLVDDLLEVSRIRGGKLRLRRTRVHLADAIRNAVADVRSLADAAGDHIDMQLPEEPIVLEADPARLTQIIVNLLNNAVKYTRGGRIRVTAERCPDGQARITVSDDGYGMPPATLERVFEMFFQGDDPRQPENSGLGLGLPLAKSLVEMHGGRITASSRGIDHGSEFEVVLPAVGGAPAVSPAPSSRDADIRPDRRRVLIVDDNADAAITLGMLIGHLGGHEVRTATSGAEALVAGAELEPEVVLLDLMMPGMDGYELARRIRQQPWGERAYVVALTGWGQEEHRRRTQEAGFDEHLTKPAEKEALQAVLKRGRHEAVSPLGAT
jgi:signal transduction histidine kinase/chemotaxis methyl-accepting protein methylase/CheY-like chemotaxis protein